MEEPPFLTEKQHFLMEQPPFLTEKQHFLMEQPPFLMEKQHFLMGEPQFFMVKFIFSMVKPAGQSHLGDARSSSLRLTFEAHGHRVDLTFQRLGVSKLQEMC